MRKIVTITMLTLALAAAAFAQQKGSFTDPRDKKTYKTVKIGTQTWTAENLNYSDKSHGKNDSKCYEDKPANCAKYGRIYNWETAMTACPKGWHLPTMEEWDALSTLAGGEGEDKNEVAEKKLKAKKGWEGEGAVNGTDDYGFAALPGGRGSAWGDFALAGNGGRWWSTSQYRRMNSYYQNIPWRHPGGSFLFSVRCLKGEPGEEAVAAIAEIEATKKARAEEEKARLAAEAAEKAAVEKMAGKQFNPDIKYGSFTDARDKTTYKTTKIADFTWMAENLKYNAKDSKCYEDKDYYCKRDGRLYDWKTALSVCPAGWHLPNKKEWDILVSTISKDEKKLKAKSGWEGDSNGTDDYGFSALPIKSGSAFWIAAADTAKYDYTAYNISGSFENNKTKLYPVRCVQGASAEETIAAVVEKSAGKQFNPKINYGSITDSRDKTTYKTVKIGEQTWMAENLNYNANGSRCFEDKDYYCKRDGRLYDWATAKTACPAGWHLPIDKEWSILVGAIGGSAKSGSKLKATSGWFDTEHKYPINGTDEFGFSAIPTGSGGYNSGKDFRDGNESSWWNASEKNNSGITSGISGFSSSTSNLRSSAEAKTLLFSIRCVQGDAYKEAPAAKPAPQQKQQPANESCQITFPKKTCIQMPAGTCKLSGGKVVDKCP